MKSYHLRILYPNSNTNSFTDKQFYEETIQAEGVGIAEGAYMFKDKTGQITAYYPVQYTIITKIR